MALTRPLINNLNTNIEIFNDTITVLHANASIANSDIGLLMNRAGGLVPNAAFYWSESTLAFVAALTSNTGVGYSNITATSYANITTGSLTASSVTSGGNVIASGFYYPNGQNVSAGSVNLSIYLNKVTATNTAYTLVDSVSNVGNTSVRWTVSSSDNVYSNFKMSTIDAVTNGANVYYTEYAVIQNNNSANVATFTSNVYNGLISLWALGGSGNVTVAVERESLGTGITTGYLSSTGPQGATGATGPAGTVANTSGYIYTSNLTAATSTTTGALQVAGGAGIGGNLYVGGNLVVSGYSSQIIANLIGSAGNQQGALFVSAANTKGGTGFGDVFQLTNASGGATNAIKWVRINNTGGLEVLNSAYSAVIFSVADNGNANHSGTILVNGNQAVNGPAFSTVVLTGQSTTSGIIANVIYNGKYYDTHNCFNTTTGVFTANIAGYYQFNWTAGANAYIGNNGIVFASMYKNNQELARGARLVANTGGMISSGSGMCYLNGTTDYVQIKFLQGSGGTATLESDSNALTNGGSYANYFSGAMVRGA